MDVTVIDVADGRLLPGQTVVVAGRWVEAVGPAGKIRVPPGARVVEARGKYLIPGLWDMHIHPLNYPDFYYPLLIAYGVTGIRDAGTMVPIATVRRWQQEVAAGTLTGPRVIVSGPSLNAIHKGSYDSPAKARHVVDSLRAAGIDMLKLSGMTKEDYFRLAAAARQAGLPFGGHVPGGRSKMLPLPVSVTQVADSGATIIDHNDGLQGAGCMGDSAGNPARLGACLPVARYLRNANTWTVPTFNVLKRHISGRGGSSTMRHVREKGGRLRLVRVSTTAESSAPEDTVPVWARMGIMDSAGVPILAGSDAAPAFPHIVPGHSLHTELAALVWAGLMPLTALQAATINPAKALRATDSLGTVAPGHLADLVLLEANPLLDIRNTIKIRAVVANGRYFDRAALDSLLANAERGVFGR